MRPKRTSVFLNATIELLKNRPKSITYALIEEETELTKHWLDSLIQRHSDDEIDFGIKKIETLYNYLSDKPFSFESEPLASQ